MTTNWKKIDARTIVQFNANETNRYSVSVSNDNGDASEKELEEAMNLIAVAPEMLEALKELLSIAREADYSALLKDSHPEEYDGHGDAIAAVFQFAEDTIAKAVVSY